MNVKTISILSLFATSQTLSASCNHYFYTGAALNTCSMPGNRSDSVTNITPATAIFTDKKSMRLNGVYGGVFAGYLFRIKNFGIGPEFFYNHGKTVDKISGTLTDFGNAITAFDIHP